jgi:hypothetical protein
MTYQITITNSFRNSGPYRMLDSAWDCSLKLEGGLYQRTNENVILRNTEGTIFLISLNNNFTFFKSATYDIEAAKFNIYEGSCPLFSFNLYEFKDPNKENEFIIASTMGGFQGSIIHFKINHISNDNLIKKSNQIIVEKAYVDEYTLPVLLGISMKEATEIMKPICLNSKIEGSKQWWHESGLMLMYNEEEILEAIYFSKYAGIDNPIGFLYGVGIGDTIEECYNSWGNQIEERIAYTSYYKIIWKYKSFKIRTEFWDEDGSTSGGDIFKKDTVRGMMIANYDTEFPW